MNKKKKGDLTFMSYNEFARVSEEASWGFAFGQRLRSLLADKNIKVSQFARKTGIPKDTIDRYLNGASIPNYYRMTLIAKELDITVERLADLRPNADILYYYDETEEDEN